ncbi:MAG TPA: hypothetical protein ENK99_02290 [Campylobacterales bacterium]|nr:hypothetical protein [Campylobacterales bacterium]HHH50970.1 hypothetical protein [Campylobacterales bacterium]
MKKIILLLVLLVTVGNAHSKLQLRRYYTYYKLGYEYSKQILADLNNKSTALENSKEMCIDTVGSIYTDSKYKGSCIYGANSSMNGDKEIDITTFLNSYIHEKF